ncbi:60S ribosomal protein L8 [Coemansia sp. RSA 2599]|nr:60S ribosomal protein L8 [Coemansia sp. RSA 2598]KAJ1823974.1 60S ribosomal protein L8 [Coemansia sp. RSA 2599]
MGVPYCIVKGKARLGTVVHQKTATALALVDIKDEDKMSLNAVVEAVNANFIDKSEEIRRTWGGGVLGVKSRAKIAKREAAAAREAAIAKTA